MGNWTCNEKCVVWDGVGTWPCNGPCIVWDDIHDDIFDTDFRFRLTFNLWNDGLSEEYTYIEWIDDSGEEWFVRKNLF